jgi:hypothetical protein
MVQKAVGSLSCTVSANYNVRREAPNVYLRVARQLGARTSLGVSAGMGRGIFFDTSHALALGLDASHDFGGLQLSSEYAVALGPGGSFQFLFGKLSYSRAGRFVPYVGAYTWHDRAQETGNFRSLVLGLNYKLTERLSLEGGLARGDNRNVYWLQSHVTL